MNERIDEIKEESKKHGIDTLSKLVIETFPEHRLSLINDIMQMNFEDGANWADLHPKSTYNVTDTDYIHCVLECIVDIASRTTSGNVSHNVNEIKQMSQSALKTFIKI